MIISFDPGGNTGIVLASEIDYQAREFKIIGKSVVNFQQRATILDILTKYADQLDVIIIEDFRLFPDKAASQAYSEFIPVKVIERITVYAELLAIADKIVMQQPAQRLSAKGFPPDHQVALGSNRHLYAAYQHLRYYIFMQKYKR